MYAVYAAVQEFAIHVWSARVHNMNGCIRLDIKYL